MRRLKPGLTGESTLVVKEKHTALHLKSGAVSVLATPIMVALMEEAARNAVDPLLKPDKISVGTLLEVTHRAPTPVGMRVIARAELREIDGRRLIFDVTAHDEQEIIGEGLHVRTAVKCEHFLDRVREKQSLARSNPHYS